MSETKPPRHIGRSIGALFAGFLVGAGLSLGTDQTQHHEFVGWNGRKVAGSVVSGRITVR